MKSVRRSAQAVSFSDRLWSVFVSLFFSVPTAMLLWFLVQVEVALYWWGDGPGVTWLLVLVVAFGVLAFMMPRLFPSLLRRIWRGIAWWW